MRQVVLKEPGEFVVQTVPLPVAAEGEALVRVHRVGVCGTDLHAFRGKQPYFSYPRVLGHELGVEVVEVPANDRGIRPGDFCAVEPYLTCGTCFSCRLGKYNTCQNIRTLGVHIDGAMRTYFTVPVKKPAPLGKTLARSTRPDRNAGRRSPRPRTGQPRPERRDPGGGGGAHWIGSRPVRQGGREERPRAGGQPAAPRVCPAVGGRNAGEREGVQADVVIDATGSQQAMEASFDLVRVCGTLVFVGLFRGRISFDDPDFNKKEMTIRGSRNSAGIFPTLIRLIEEGKIDTRPWITHRMPLSAVPQEFPQLYQKPDLVKAVIEVEAD